MKFSGRFKSRLEVNVGIGGCVSSQPNFKPFITHRFRGLLAGRGRSLRKIGKGLFPIWLEISSWKRRGRDDSIVIAG
jgi:hypothetical protein